MLSFNGTEDNLRAQSHPSVAPPPEAFASIAYSQTKNRKNAVNLNTTNRKERRFDKKEQSANDNSKIKFQIHDENEPIEKESLEIGDHIYVWRGFRRLRIYQRHAIVFSISSDRSEIMVATFFPQDSIIERDEKSDNAHLKSREIETFESGIDSKQCVKKIPLKEFASGASIHKVQYSTRFFYGVFRQSGTSTSMDKDPLLKIITRINYLFENPQSLPPFDILTSNCECVSVWCCTGRYTTLQASSMLGKISSLQAKGALVVSSVTLIKVPVVLSSPMLLSCFSTYVGASLISFEIVRRIKKQWSSVSKGLNNEMHVLIDKATSSSTEIALGHLKSHQDAKKSTFNKMWNWNWKPKQCENTRESWGDVEIPDW